jgi:hypothetical protein
MKGWLPIQADEKVLIFQQGKKGGFFEQVSKQIGQDKYTAET